MAITFDNEMSLSYIYRYDDSAGTYSSRLEGSSAFDYFDDDATVGDMIYFGKRTYAHPWHNLKFYIGTPLVADSISIVWEYYKSGTGWTAIPSLTDNTNNFTTAGQQWVTFPMPEKMYYNAAVFYQTINGMLSVWVRCRITAVTNITEGGAQSTQTVKGKDYTITIESGTTASLANIYTADVAGGWNVVEKITNHNYLIKSNLYVAGTFWTKEEIFQIGDELVDNPMLFWADGSCSVEFGELNGDYGSRGSTLYWYNRNPSSYAPVRNTKIYGSTIIRKVGSYETFMFDGTMDLRDSVLRAPVTYYFPSSISSGKFYRTLYDVPSWFYLYSPNVEIDGLKMIPSSAGFLSGGSSVIENVHFTAIQRLKRFHNAQVQLINCEGPTNANILSFSPTGAGDKYVYRKFTLDLKVIDKDNNPVSGASVKIDNVDGTNVVNVTTYANGTIDQQTITAYQKWWVYAEGWAMHEKDFNDFTLQISKAGYQTYTKKFTLDEEIDWRIALTPARIHIDQECLA